MEPKIRAIQEVPVPTSKSELKSFTGLVNYYGRFIPNLSAILAPLNRLLCKDVEWSWGLPEQEAFEKAKAQLSSSAVLVHFDANKPLILTCDASPEGLGAILSHVMEDGSERPVTCISRTLSSAEKVYSQLEKESLAVVFGVKRLHEYLYGRHFTIKSDHQPLENLLNKETPISPLTSARIQRWALTLSAYEYDFKYTPGRKIAHADAMSRSHLSDCPNEVPQPPETIFLMEMTNMSPLSYKEMSLWTSRDPILSPVYQYVVNGWPDQCSDEFKAYKVHADELSTYDGCILWGTRLVVPPQVRSKVLEVIHDTHPGIVKMKAIARSYVWWPNIDAQIEEKARSCPTCQKNKQNSSPCPVASLGVAKLTVGENTCGLCRTIHEQNVSDYM